MVRTSWPLAGRGRSLGIALAMLFSAWTLRAATLEATLDREVIALGESAALLLSVQGLTAQGLNEVQLPSVPEIAGLRIERVRGPNTSIRTVNGRTSVAYDVVFQVTPTQLGEFTIPACQTPWRGTTLTSSPLKLKVVKAGDPAAARGDGLDNAAFLNLVVPTRPVYVGETFVAEAWLNAIGGELRQPPQFRADGFTLGRTPERPTRESNIRTNNQVYSRLRFLQPLTAAKAGDLPLLAQNCIHDVIYQRRPSGQDPFEDFFGMGRETRRFTLSTEPATLRVLPLPKDKVPPGFGGAVGQFLMSLVASPTNVTAGDPITVRIEISGRGNFDAVQIPEQPGWTGFRLYPPTANFETQDPLGLMGTKRFEQVATPESPTLTQLPPLVFSYFDPEERTYKTLRSAAIPLRVNAGASTPLVPNIAGGGAATNVATPDLLPLRPHLGEVVVAQASLATQPWFVALSLAPLTVWAGLAGWRRARDAGRRDAAANERRRWRRQLDDDLAALKTLASQQDSTAFHATLFRALQLLLGLRLHQPPAGITEGVLDELSRQPDVSAETVASLHRLFQAANQARYARSASAGDLETLRRELEVARGLLRTES